MSRNVMNLPAFEVRPISIRNGYSLKKEDLYIRERELKDELSIILDLIKRGKLRQAQGRIRGPFKWVYCRYEEMRKRYQLEEEEIKKIMQRYSGLYNWEPLPDLYVNRGLLINQIGYMPVPVDLSFFPEIDDLSNQLEELEENFSEEERRLFSSSEGKIIALQKECNKLRRDTNLPKWVVRGGGVIKKAKLLVSQTETRRASLETQRALYEHKMQWLEGSSTTTPWYKSEVRKIERKLLSFQERYQEAQRRERMFVSPSTREMIHLRDRAFEASQMLQIKERELKKLSMEWYPLREKDLRIKQLRRNIAQVRERVFKNAEKEHINRKMEEMASSLLRENEERRKSLELARRRDIIQDVFHDLPIHSLLESEEGEEYVWMEDALDIIKKAF
jgi:hypothetical protein